MPLSPLISAPKSRALSRNREFQRAACSSFSSPRVTRRRARRQACEFRKGLSGTTMERRTAACLRGPPFLQRERLRVSRRSRVVVLVLLVRRRAELVAELLLDELADRRGLRAALGALLRSNGGTLLLLLRNRGCALTDAH